MKNLGDVLHPLCWFEAAQIAQIQVHCLLCPPQSYLDCETQTEMLDTEIIESHLAQLEISLVKKIINVILTLMWRGNIGDVNCGLLPAGAYLRHGRSHP